jgi:hypothetical protein
MVFKMHTSGLHYYDPNDNGLTFINTLDDNKKASLSNKLMRLSGHLLSMQVFNSNQKEISDGCCRATKSRIALWVPKILTSQ